jgi:hypothetical protein
MVGAARERTASGRPSRGYVELSAYGRTKQPAENVGALSLALPASGLPVNAAAKIAATRASRRRRINIDTGAAMPRVPTVLGNGWSAASVVAFPTEGDILGAHD